VALWGGAAPGPAGPSQSRPPPRLGDAGRRAVERDGGPGPIRAVVPPPGRFRMKILYVTNVFPYPPHDGGRIRRYHLFRALAAAHQVTVLAAVPISAELEEFRRLYPEACFVPIPVPADGGRVPIAQAVRELLARERFDAVHVAEVWQWPGER